MTTLDERSRPHQLVIDLQSGRIIHTTVHEIVRNDAGKETVIANTHEHVTLNPGEFEKAAQVAPELDAVFKAVWTAEKINDEQKRLQERIEAARKVAADEAEAAIRRQAAAEAENQARTDEMKQDAEAQKAG